MKDLPFAATGKGEPSLATYGKGITATQRKGITLRYLRAGKVLPDLSEIAKVSPLRKQKGIEQSSGK